MHQATGAEIEKAEELKRHFEKNIDSAFCEFGPDSPQFQAAVYACQEYVGWLYVVGKADSVNRSLAEVSKMAAYRYSERGLPTPTVFA